MARIVLKQIIPALFCGLLVCGVDGCATLGGATFGGTAGALYDIYGSARRSRDRDDYN